MPLKLSDFETIIPAKSSKCAFCTLLNDNFEVDAVDLQQIKLNHLGLKASVSK